MAAKKFHVVWVGQQPGIYTTWPEARRQVKDYPGAKFKSFPNLPSAEAAYADKPAAATRSVTRPASKPATKLSMKPSVKPSLSLH